MLGFVCVMIVPYIGKSSRLNNFTVLGNLLATLKFNYAIYSIVINVNYSTIHRKAYKVFMCFCEGFACAFLYKCWEADEMFILG